MMNTFKYFENRECKFYPCHEMGDKGGVNCLFCYCPLYFMKDCPGTYHYVEKGGKKIKSCVDCTFPHEEGNYGEMIKKINDLIQKEKGF
ncbi:MAG: cysteine-rich small domain-containing protein [Lachnospiraceae bacterium]|nr:cysteine-rich small domain-containing protein [Lachnospiraceae bacterium]